MSEAETYRRAARILAEMDEMSNAGRGLTSAHMDVGWARSYHAYPVNAHKR